MRLNDPTQPIVVRSDDGTRIEVAAISGGVHLAMDRTEAVLDQRSADDLIHALVEAIG